MKRILALLLALALIMSLAACGGETQPETTEEPETTTLPQNTTPEAPDAPDPSAAPSLDCSIVYFMISYGENFESLRNISAWPNEDGTFHVEYEGDVKKVGDLDMSVVAQIAAALENSGLVALNGQDVYEDGESYGDVTVMFDDGSYLAASYSGNVPEEFITGYQKMDEAFRQLTAELEEYVPQPIVLNEVDPADLAVLQQIIDNSGLEPLDAYTISSIEKDDTFAYIAGLSSPEGIARGVSFAPMMMTSAYSLVIVTLEEGTDAAAVCSDFAATMDWRKWVCVAPSQALIAQKDNLVLCLMGSDTVFAQTAAAIKAAGWTVVQELNNPDMQ